MTVDEEQGLTPVGEILERARGSMSKREAARIAKISEARWRQVVTGHQVQSGVQIPVNPRRQTVIRMARAVGANVNDALLAAGFEPESEHEADVVAVHQAAISEWFANLTDQQREAVWVIMRDLAKANSDSYARSEERPDLAWAADRQVEISEGHRLRAAQDVAGEEPQVEP